MADIVKRLRQGIKASKFNDWDFERTEADMEEGAAEIEKLRAALLCFKAMMADDRYDVGEVVEEFSQIARAALEEK